MEIGTKIKQLRYRASLTQEQLGAQLGVSAQAISKWENAAAMPDITLLPELAEIFGISIDELFDLTAEQKVRRIENRMEVEEDLDPEIFKEYEEFLKELASGAGPQKPDADPQKSGAGPLKALSVLAHLYYHRMESYSRRTAECAREAIRRAPEKKECQWLLQKTEGSAVWDWNVSNHSKIIDFYKQVIADDAAEPGTPLPYYYLIDNLIADHRTEEARTYLKQFAALPAHKRCMVPVYEAAIALAEYREKEADAIIEKALAEYKNEPDLLFEAAQYYAKKCDYTKAIEYYEADWAATENKKPRFIDPLQGISVIYEITGDYQKAAETQRRILAVLKEEWGFSEETIVQETKQEIERLEGKEKHFQMH